MTKIDWVPRKPGSGESDSFVCLSVCHALGAKFGWIRKIGLNWTANQFDSGFHSNNRLILFFVYVFCIFIFRKRGCGVVVDPTPFASSSF